MVINEDDLIFDGLEAFEAWKALAGEKAARYFTPSVAEENKRALTEWGMSNIIGGLVASTQIGFYEISFAQCVKAGTLKADPDYRSQADRNAEFANYFATQTAEKSRERYFSDPEFARFIDTQ